MENNHLDLSIFEDSNSKSGFSIKGFYPNLDERLRLSREYDHIYDDLIPQIADFLNTYHGITRSARYWEILVGPFLKRYLRVMMNRVITFDKTVLESSITHVHFGNKPKYFVAQNTISYIELIDTEQFTQSVYFDLINDFYPEIKIELTDDTNSHNELKLGSDISYSEKTRASKFLSNMLLVIQKLLIRGRIFIHDMHGSKKLKILFHILNIQLPYLIKNKTSIKAVSGENRKALNNIKCSQEPREKYHEAIEKYLFKHLPRCFVEDFHELISSNIFKEYPSSPEVIVTSTAFDSDEYFKAWLGTMVEKNSKYVVLQHGAVYGTNPFTHDTVEERTSDYFLTWGWERSSQHDKAFCFNTAYEQISWKEESKTLLLIQVIKRRNKFIWDTEIEYINYMHDQVDFIKGLSNKVQRNVLIRLKKSYKRRCPNQKRLLQSASSIIAFDDGIDSFQNLVKESRLVIFAYESSGFLELLSLDFPVIAFWDDQGFDQHHDDLDEFYSALIDVGILHTSGKSAAKFVNTIWNNVDNWWQSSDTVTARAMFTNKFASTAKRPALDLMKILRQSQTQEN